MYGKRIVGSIDDIDGLDKTDCVVIIAVKNVFEHSKIADHLVKSGINSILYKPHSVLSGEGTEDEKRISECYDCLLGNQLEKLSHIPETKEVVAYVCKDSALIREEGAYVWARVPTCLIYANRTDEKESVWEDISILRKTSVLLLTTFSFQRSVISTPQNLFPPQEKSALRRP